SCPPSPFSFTILSSSFFCVSNNGCKSIFYPPKTIHFQMSQYQYSLFFSASCRQNIAHIGYSLDSSRPYFRIRYNASFLTLPHLFTVKSCVFFYVVRNLFICFNPNAWNVL